MTSMAKVQRLTQKQVLSLTTDQMLRMSKPELRLAVQTLADVANKRVKRAEAGGFISPAISDVQRGGRFSTKGLTLNQLRQEFARAKGFLQDPTTTKKGYKSYVQQIREEMEDMGYEGLSDNQIARMISLHDELSRVDPGKAGRDERYKIYKELAEMTGGGSYRDGEAVETDLTNAINSASNAFEGGEQSGMGESGISSYFRI